MNNAQKEMDHIFISAFIIHIIIKAHALLKNTCILTQMTPEAMYIEKEKGLEDFLKQVFSVFSDIHLYV